MWYSHLFSILMGLWMFALLSAGHLPALTLLQWACFFGALTPPAWNIIRTHSDLALDFFLNIKTMGISYTLSISSSVVPFSSCPQSFPVSGSFPMSQLFTSGGQSFGISASASVLPMNIQDWFPLGWTGWISLQSKGISSIFSNTTVQKHQFFSTQPSLWSKSHIRMWLLEKP